MTQETGNNIASFLNTSISRESTLLVEWSADFFCYSIFHQQKNEVIYSHVGTHFIDLADWTSQQFSRLIKDETALGFQYQKTIHLINTPWATLIPQSFLEEKHLENVLKFNVQLPATPLSYRADNIDKSDYALVYAVPKDLQKVLDESFADVTIKSMTTQLIESYLTGNTDTLYLHFSNSLLHISYIENQKLLFHNQFQCNSDEDTLYNVLNVMQQLELDTEKCLVKCAGNIVATSEKYKLLLSYIRNIEMQERLVKLNYAESIDEMPHHYFRHHYEVFLG